MRYAYYAFQAFTSDLIRFEMMGTYSAILLMDSSAYPAFHAGKEYRYFPVLQARFKVPYSGYWYLVAVGDEYSAPIMRVWVYR